MTEHVPWRRAARFLGAVALAVVSLRVLESVVRIVVWRSHYQPALDLLRRYNKAVTNRPAALEKAAERGKVTLVHHAGRRSGREYVTPVWGVRVGQSCYVQLPYGTRVDWCRNVLKAGGCTFDHDGLRYHAVDPVIVPAAQARPLLPPATQRMQRLIGAESYLRLDIDGVTPSPPRLGRDDPAQTSGGPRCVQGRRGPGHQPLPRRDRRRPPARGHRPAGQRREDLHLHRGDRAAPR